MSAAARREALVETALRHFALNGFHGTSTEAIARDAGISQPYLFRLFGTKRDLFVACAARCHERIRDTFAAAAEGVAREERFAHMGKAYVELLADRHYLLFQLQMYTATTDPVIQQEVREGYRQLVNFVLDVTGAPPEEAWAFFSHGMLLNVVASLELHTLADEEAWARAWAEPFAMTGYGDPQ